MFSGFDYQVLLALNSFSFLDRFMLFISLRFDYFLFLILVLLFYFRGRGDTFLYLAVLYSAWALAMVLKPIFAVPRPEDVRFVTCTTGYSMPSGHTLMSFASAVFLHPRAGKFKLLIWIFAVLVSLSRVFIGVHYPSDVLVGAVLGCMLGFFWLYMEKWLVNSGFLRDILFPDVENKK
ncbi:phosphatase PAP2 family protein [Methanosarcina sp. KYL-1]|uniref:phosphatase PAP2 family protein n=1 Tax=Methanosarcina sp. KYL-1 TaxID=2602068 RepID=UPI002101499A|nr:phosphatase PAP2 family protein [Methanosarcina sp. KYL-1]MCQ1534348.1 phosphatase PAP2 family protein [Methanosarcina sp. KYL-1]